jgi:hypothetical protein
MMSIRFATAADLAAMLRLADNKRSQYMQYAPTFWRKAADGAAKQRSFFQSLLTKPNVIALVHEEQASVNGFLIASLIDAPPVYDPGSQVCLIDDFVVADDAWATIGYKLLQRVQEQAATRQAQLTVVVSGHLDEPKRAMLQAAGFGIASEWYIKPL